MQELIHQRGAAGPEALLGAIIIRALKDARGRDQEARDSAWSYLAGDLFRHHTEVLGMAPDTMPAEVERWAQRNGC